jgi:predicted N-acetyltransferase YhbS
VLPSWQGEGLGRALIERLTARLLEDQITSITLFAEPTVVKMYERLDFQADPQGVKGMTFRPSYR